MNVQSGSMIHRVSRRMTLTKESAEATAAAVATTEAAAAAAAAVATEESTRTQRLDLTV